MTGRAGAHIAVIDIGKTNAKVALADRASLEEIAVVTRPNRVLSGPPWPHFDLEGHWDFILGALGDFHARHGVGAITVTTHGASCVLLDAGGGLAVPMLDYEHDGPDAAAAAYDAMRPDFAVTGSPRLGQGLNLGAQLHWQFSVMPGLRDRVAQVLTYPQYWGFRLTGVAASDVTSLGCHTDLWDPFAARFSPLVAALGLAGRIAPPRAPADALGPVLPAVAAATGLDRTTPVHCGIHDSNASLLPHLLSRAPPFAVVSTGTWVVAMAVGGGAVTLDPARDTLVNVNAAGAPVPSARFMGGREHDLALGSAAPAPADADIAAALASGAMLLPALVAGSGPFQGRAARWIGAEPAQGTGARAAAVGFYLALVTAECLRLVGHRGPVIVEGPFARNRAYLAMLATATGSEVEAAPSATGTSQGAALLACRDLPATAPRRIAARPDPGGAMEAYARAWRAAI
jgi:sugar (pentulose or hexulose) kinase